MYRKIHSVGEKSQNSGLQGIVIYAKLVTKTSIFSTDGTMISVIYNGKNVSFQYKKYHYLWNVNKARTMPVNLIHVHHSKARGMNSYD